MGDPGLKDLKQRFAIEKPCHEWVDIYKNNHGKTKQ